MDIEIKKEKKFTYIEEGQGHPVIILHGLFGGLSNFTDVVSEFSKDYRVIVPMLPLMEMPILLTNISNLAKFVNRFAKHKELENFTIVGNSLGGHIALVFAVKHPKKVHSLVLTGSSGLYENAFGSTFPKRENKEFIREKVALTFYDPKIATDEIVDECFEVVNNRLKVIRVLSLAKSAIRHNMEKELHKIMAPTCLIWGKNDTITPPNVAKDFNRLLPKSELHWIDKCGHAAMMEHPKQFNELLGTFLKKVVQ